MTERLDSQSPADKPSESLFRNAKIGATLEEDGSVTPPQPPELGPLLDALRPVVSTIFNDFGSLSRGQALQMLVNAVSGLTPRSAVERTVVVYGGPGSTAESPARDQFRYGVLFRIKGEASYHTQPPNGEVEEVLVRGVRFAQSAIERSEEQTLLEAALCVMEQWDEGLDQQDGREYENASKDWADCLAALREWKTLRTADRKAKP